VKEMSKQKSAFAGGVVGELFQTGVYKRSQGRWSRQVTFAAIAVIVLFTAYKMYYAGWFSAKEANAAVSIVWLGRGTLGCIPLSQRAKICGLFDCGRSRDEQGILADLARAFTEVRWWSFL